MDLGQEVFIIRGTFINRKKGLQYMCGLIGVAMSDFRDFCERVCVCALFT